MATKMKKTAEPLSKSNTMIIQGKPGKSRDALLAEAAMGAPTTGALAATEFSKGIFGELSLGESIAVLKDKVSAVQRGDLRDAEALLTTQAVALNVIFTELARRAALNMSTCLAVTDTYLRLALKAQSQCRTTLETLATIKHPPNVAFVRQANIAHHQQVNNAPTAPRARENNFQQT